MLKTALLSLKKGPDDKYHDEYQYLNLIKDILTHGHMEIGRNGRAQTIIGSSMHFSLENNTIPLLTTKRVAWKTCLRELLWMMKGSTDNKILQTQGVHIWDGNSSREFLNSRNLDHLKENDLGPIYGHQWRFFDAPYTTCKQNYKGCGIDQLEYIIENLKNPETRNSRRLVMSAWNPNQLNEMALPPCHVLAQFNVVNDNELSCSLYQRSGDVGLGVPFNIASYSFLTHIIAKHCNLKATEFIYHLGNAHIYDDHILQLSKQTERLPLLFPKIDIKRVHDNINNYTEEDINIENYQYYPSIKMEMRK